MTDTTPPPEPDPADPDSVEQDSEEAARPRQAWVVVLVVLLAAVAGGAWFLLRPPTVAEEIAAVEKAWRALRDAIVEEDDEAFFMMHCREAREDAVEGLPIIRSRYLAAPEAERERFRAAYRITDEEFRRGEPRDLVVKFLPWKSGWRDRREIYRLATVKDVLFNTVHRDGEAVREAQVILDITDSLAPEGLEALRQRQKDPDDYMPAVVFVKDPEGWRRREFFPR